MCEGETFSLRVRKDLMKPRPFAVLAFVLAAGLAVEGRAVAEPVTLNYVVTVNQRHDFTAPVDQWHWVFVDPIVFRLSMTFDTAVTNTVVTPDFTSNFFGPAVFSPVPLRGAGATQGETDAYTRIDNFAFGTRRQRALAGSDLSWQSNSSSDQVSLRGNYLLSPHVQPPLPAGAAGDVGAFLRAMNGPVEFNFYDFILDWVDERGDRLPQPVFAAGSSGYFGTAVPASPIPEPATVTLLGLGLAVTSWRARRRPLP